MVRIWSILIVLLTRSAAGSMESTSGCEPASISALSAGSTAGCSASRKDCHLLMPVTKAVRQASMQPMPCQHRAGQRTENSDAYVLAADIDLVENSIMTNQIAAETRMQINFGIFGIGICRHRLHPAPHRRAMMSSWIAISLRLASMTTKRPGSAFARSRYPCLTC